jgi:hypothetical protein
LFPRINPLAVDDETEVCRYGNKNEPSGKSVKSKGEINCRKNQ